MLRGGRGGEVRLKLFLTLLLMSVGPPHATSYPTRAFAELFDLPDPDGTGSRRVREALVWLRERKLIQVEARAGKAARVFVRLESGSGAVYSLPTKETDLWIKVPTAMWTKGWISALSGSAIAILLLLIDHAESLGKVGKAVWISPSQAKDDYALSSDTWTRGIRELERYRLVRSEIVYERAAAWGHLLRRKKVTLRMSRLNAGPPSTTLDGI